MKQRDDLLVLRPQYASSQVGHVTLQKFCPQRHPCCIHFLHKVKVVGLRLEKGNMGGEKRVCVIDGSKLSDTVPSIFLSMDFRNLCLKHTEAFRAIRSLDIFLSFCFLFVFNVFEQPSKNSMTLMVEDNCFAEGKNILIVHLPFSFQKVMKPHLNDFGD